MDMDQQARAAVAPFLHPGESIHGVGFASNVVPMMARFVPILVSAYTGHHLLVATDRRLFVLGTGLIVLMGRPERITSTSVLSFCDIATATPFSPTILGHSALRIERKDGVVHELMWPATKDNVPHHAAFVSSFPGWLQQRLPSGFPPLEPDPRLPVLAAPPLAGHTYLVVVGAIGAAVMMLGAFAGIAPGDVRPVAFALAIAFGLIAAGASMELAERKRLLAMPMPARVQHVAQKRAGGAKPRSPLRLALLAGLASVPVVSCVGTGLQRAMYRSSDDGPTTSSAGATGRRGRDRGDRGDSTPSPAPAPAPAPAPPPLPRQTTSEIGQLLGKRVMVRWPEDRKLYDAKIEKVYGKLAYVVLDDKSWMWADLLDLTPSQLPAVEPSDPPCAGVLLGGRVIGAYVNSHDAKWPARAIEIYHQRVRLRYDDGKIAWAECNDVKR